MAEGLNRVMLLGNLGADPELRFTQGGQAVLNMRLATTESYLDKDRVRRERTDWHNVVVWGKRGEALAKILTKGSRILVEGSIRTSSYDDREGQKRYKTEIHVNNVILAGSRPQGGGDEAPQDQRQHRSPPGTGGGYSRQPPQGQHGGGRSAGPARPQAPANAGGNDDEYTGDYGGGGTDDEIPF
jgi:single-strand DNA-binding protein